jgi:uncharacterized protein (DUF885 family)
MKRLASRALWIAAALLFVAPPAGAAETTFAQTANEFVDGFLGWRPQHAVDLGLHAYDGRVSDLGRESLEREHGRLKTFAARFTALAQGKLSDDERYECRLLQTAIENELFDFEAMRVYDNNPMAYVRAFDANLYIKRNYAPLAQRTRALISAERGVPAILAAARANLAPTLAKPYVETAINIAGGTADFLAHELVEALAELNDPSLQAQFKQTNDRAVAEFRAYAEWLKAERLPSAHDRIALGKENYRRLLSGELIDLPPERILEIGLRELKREQDAFAAAARKIDPAKPAAVVFREIQHDHPSETSLLPDTRKHLEAIRSFLGEHRIISLPSDVRVRVTETLPYKRATSFASMDTPGPFETDASEAYYYVTPVETNWPAAQKEEWLTAFNYYTTDVVSIHEAYPGHYVQFLHMNASPVTRIEKIFASYAFTEGWAHYCEQMLIEEGYGASGDPVVAAKYQLAQSDEALLRLCRLCVSVKMHCEGLSLEDGAKFFQENCYYEAKPSQAEAMRGTFDPGYLYYTLGKLQIYKLRRDWQAQEGPTYSLKRFHDELLRHGAPPIRLLREKMLRDPASWSAIL